MRTTFQAAEPIPADPPRARKARVFPRPGRVVAVALLLWLSVVGGVAFVWGGVELLRTDRPEFGFLALGGLGTFAVGRGVAFLLSRSVVCPLCHGTVMHEKRCQKHGEAQKLPLLSHRASTALSVLCSGAFRCMYCGTSYRLKK